MLLRCMVQLRASAELMAECCGQINLVPWCSEWYTAATACRVAASLERGGNKSATQ